MGDDLSFSLSKKKLESLKKIKPEFIIFLLFIATSILYLRLDGVPLTNPGNIKAADPFYHVTETELIIDTKQWNYLDVRYAAGQEKAMNYIPPLFNINSAILTIFSQVPAWVTLYFLIALSQAFFTILVYLIAKEVFENSNIGVLAAFFSVLPIPLDVWLYGLYIGFWVQVPAFFFFMAYIWLFIKYFKEKNAWILFFMGLCISSVMLIHSSDLIMMFFPSIVIGISLLLDLRKDIKKFVKHSLMFGLIPSIMFLTMLTRFLYVWKSHTSNWYSLGFFGFRDLFPDPRVYPQFLNFPLYVTIPFIVGILIMVISFVIGLEFVGLKKSKIKLKKKRFSVKTTWLLITLYYFAIVFLSSAFFSGPVYLAKARALQPFFVYPTAAFIIYTVIQSISSLIVSKKYVDFINLVAIIILGTLLIFQTLPSYNNLRNQLSYEHITLDEWNAMKWLHDNTPLDSKVLFFGGIMQAEEHYSKRTALIFPLEEVQLLINDYLATNITPTKFNAHYGGNALRATRVYEKGFFKYGNYDEPKGPFDLSEIDYIFFQDLNEQLAQVNRFFANEYIQKFNFSPAYFQSGYIIIKNENN